MHLMFDDIMYSVDEQCKVKFASWRNIYHCSASFDLLWNVVVPTNSFISFCSEALCYFILLIHQGTRQVSLTSLLWWTWRTRVTVHCPPWQVLRWPHDPDDSEGLVKMAWLTLCIQWVWWTQDFYSRNICFLSHLILLSNPPISCRVILLYFA